MTSTPWIGFSTRVQTLHEACLATASWPAQPRAEDEATHDPLWVAIAHNHRFNRLLWLEEDLARRTQVRDAEIAANKRAIDGHNQARNDAIERIDEWLLLALQLVEPASVTEAVPLTHAPADARLHSETAGAMIDKLSILAMKCHAMQAQTQRSDVEQAHRDACRTKLDRLQEQRNDLAACLDALLADCAAGRAYFKVYRQFKMYNDPRLNPALVAEQASLRRS